MSKEITEIKDFIEEMRDKLPVNFMKLQVEPIEKQDNLLKLVECKELNTKMYEVSSVAKPIMKFGI